jgi:hypothetical protein
MTTSIEIRGLPAQHLLVKKTTCAHKDIGPAFRAAIHSVAECVRASETKMASAPIAVYLAWRASDCDMAVGFQVQANVTLAPGCEWLDLPGGPHAVATHFGPYFSHQFAVVGDTAVDAKCGEEFWRTVIVAMQPGMKQGDFTGALVHGVEKVGSVLAMHFPPDPERKDDLSDAVFEG